MRTLSPLQKERLQYVPQVAKELESVTALDFEETSPVGVDGACRASFTHLQQTQNYTITSCAKKTTAPLKVGVVLSGGQASGGHNVITALLDTLQQFHPESVLIGFLDGPSGIVKNSYKELTQEYLASYRNQGGFDCIGSGRTKIETPEQFEKALQTVQAHDLDGLVVIGGDDSNTNACFLAEYFLAHNQKTCVVGVPKTIDGDLQNDAIEISFGFDTACKTYAETIGNIARDALSAKKYYYFIKLMGRSASHVTLECAMLSEPNLALIAEEVQQKNMKLSDVVDEIAALVKERKAVNKSYGIILIPEGIIEFLPDVKALIFSLNALLAKGTEHANALDNMTRGQEKIDYVMSLLGDHEKETFSQIPHEIQKQLLLDRDPHGNVQVSKIETEKLFIELVSQKIPLQAQPIFCGYEGRSCLPSNFDATYCYNLGRVSALLIARKKTGFIASIKNLHLPYEKWKPHVAPLVSMLHPEIREGKEKLVIQKALVKLDQNPFTQFAAKRSSWRVDDHYCQQGPIQFFGPKNLTDSVPIGLRCQIDLLQ